MIQISCQISRFIVSVLKPWVPCYMIHRNNVNALLLKIFFLPLFFFVWPRLKKSNIIFQYIFNCSAKHSLKSFTGFVELGHGAFGVVYRAKVKADGEIVALKEVNNVGTGAYKEVQILQNITHPNIIRFIATFEENRKLYIVMEYADKGTLATLGMDWNEKNIWEFTEQLAAGLSYLHGKRIIHRDLKPNNILCVSAGNRSKVMFKISDFGIAKLFQPSQGRNYYTGTAIGYVYRYCYVAPEVLKDEEYTFSADMFSFGALISFVCNKGNHLFRSTDEILNWQGTEDPVPLIYTSDLRNIVSDLLRPNYRNRPSADEVCHIAVERQKKF